MSNHNRRLFFGALLLTLLLFAWLTAFFIVDHTSSRFQSAAAPALAVQQSQNGQWQLSLLGERYPLPQHPYAQLTAFRQKYAVLLTPGPLLALEQWGAWAKCGTEKIYEAYFNN